MFETSLQFFDFIKERKFSRDISALRDSILQTLNSNKFSAVVRQSLVRRNDRGVPFDIFSTEPEQICQIKKIINALYYAQISLEDVEGFNLRGSYKKYYNDLIVFLFSTVNNIYQACHLSTHFDIDLSEIFREEFAVILPLIEMFEEYAVNFGDKPKALFTDLDSQTIPRRLGVAAGIVVDQLGPQSGDVDFEFLAKYSAALPEYIDKLTGYFEKFTNEVTEYHPNIDKDKLDELQDNALRLLTSLERTRGGNTFLPLRVLYYIYIIRHTINISLSIYDEAGHLSVSAQDALRAKLEELKNELLPELLSLTDKIESHTMLTPGYLSKPLMSSISRLYSSLIAYSEKFVDFKVAGNDLVTIDDAKFISMRLEKTYKRIAAEKETLLLVEKVRNEATEFFLLVNQPQYKGKRIIDLPDDIKARLAAHYKQMKPYVLLFNIPLNNAIINGLTTSKGSFDGIFQTINWLSGSKNTDSIVDVALLQRDFEAKITQIIETHKLNIKLNCAIIDDASLNNYNLKLFSYDPNNNPVAINEPKIFRFKAAAEIERINKGPHPLTQRQSIELIEKESLLIQLTAAEAVSEKLPLETLGLEEVKLLHKIYHVKSDRLEHAKKAYAEFFRLISGERNRFISAFSVDEKMQLRNLYGIFQPYLVSGLLDIGIEEVKKIDASIISSVSVQDIAEKAPLLRIDIRTLKARNLQLKLHFALAKDRLDERRVAIDLALKSLIHRKQEEQPLIICTTSEREHFKQEEQPLIICTTSEREHFVIKKDIYAKAISDFSDSVYKLTGFFNETLRNQLTKAQSGVPFPELDDLSKILEQGEQVLPIKQLFNCLYHIEQTSKKLQELDDRDFAAIYSGKVINCGYHLHKAYGYLEGLIKNPSFVFLAAEAREKFQVAYGLLIEASSHYIPDSSGEDEINLNDGHSPAIFYSLNAMKVLPVHIKSLLDDEELTPEIIDELHSNTLKVTDDIERIIKNSSSYFKLFLEIPTVYKLFGELKAAIALMAKSSHDVAVNNLANINDKILTSILLEADKWEDSIGLIPGTITGPLKEMLDSFFQGFISPLAMRSQEHLSFVFSTKPLEQRYLAAEKLRDQSIIEQRKFAENLDLLKHLSTYIKNYNGSSGATLEFLSTLKSSIISDFNAALPILKELHPQLSQYCRAADPSSLKIDTLLNGNLTYEPRLINIESMVDASISYYKGVHATNQNNIFAAQQKLLYINKLVQVQREQIILYKEKYTNLSFEKQVSLLTAREVGLIHSKDEYNRKLVAFLYSFKETIVNEAKNDVDIDKKVARLLGVKIRHFEQENYKNFYHLEIILSAINNFRQYIFKANIDFNAGNSLFEDASTLRSKTTLVRSLGEIASNENLPLDERVRSLSDKINRRTFETRILAFKSYDTFTYSWLKQCIVNLLESIGLYITDKKKCYSQLIKSVEKPSFTIMQLSSRFGLFSGDRIDRGYDIPQNIDQVVNVAP